jgi:uncharacterized YigZ family protein
MQFTTKEFSTILEIKKSKFIAYICPYSDFKQMIDRLKKEHTKARHFVYAYRYLNEFEQIVENSSDDGEPKGTSGKPTLSVLAGASIINSAVVVVRYFGGIKLGTGGLVKAYSDTVNLLLKEITLEKFIKLEQKQIIVIYPYLSKIEYLIKKLNITIKDKEFNDKIVLTLETSNEKFNDLSCELLKNNIVLDI